VDLAKCVTFSYFLMINRFQHTFKANVQFIMEEKSSKRGHRNRKIPRIPITLSSDCLSSQTSHPMLRIFNIDSDLALASNDAHYLAPRPIRQLQRTLGPCAAWWADSPNDVVVVDSLALAEEFERRNGTLLPHVRWAMWDNLPLMEEISPWGWNRQITSLLKLHGVPDTLLPDETRMAEIRRLANRATAVAILRHMVPEEGESLPCGTPLCGRAHICLTEEDAMQAVTALPQSLLKMPWSGSGKGIRLGHGTFDAKLSAWCRRTLQTQGSIVVEPRYTRILDLAMLFTCDGKGGTRYLGLSIFRTTGSGTYVDNLVDSEANKTALITQYVAAEDLDLLRQRMEQELTSKIAPTYCGPLSVDMMICRWHRTFALHPCVEINLRHTMGYVALKLTGKVPDGTFMTLEDLLKLARISEKA
jgi:hypothetical protein